MTYGSAYNVTESEIVLQVTLTKTANTGSATLIIIDDDVFDAKFNSVEYEIVYQELNLG